MAGFSGRKLTIDLETTKILGVTSKTMSESREYVDVTNDDDNGHTVYLPEAGKRSGEVSVSGVTVDKILVALITTFPETDQTVEINFPMGTGNKISGEYLIQSLSQVGETGDAVRFEMTLVRNGAPTYAAGT